MSTNNPPVTSSAIPINNNNTMDRRGSVSTAVFSTFFHRANSMSAPTVNTDLPRRRQSTTATGPYPVNYSTSPTSVSPALSRRSTFDENAIEDDDVPSPLNGRSPVTSNRSSRRASFSLQPRTLNGTYTLDSSSPGTSGTQTPAARTQRPSVSGGPAKSALTAGLRDAETPALRGSYLAGAVRRLSVTGSAAASAAASAIQASETSPSSPASSSHFRTSSFSTPLTNPLSSSVPRNADQVQSQYFTWSDQLRNRAEGRSAIAGSPPRMGMSPASYGHMRSGSLSAAAESASMRGPNNVGVSSSRSRCYRGFESDWSFDAATLSKKKWMSALPDTVNVSALSIPGTHDTMTYTVDDIRLQCQNINLTSQLHAGIRYIDGRTRLQGDTLAIYHASQATGHTLQDLFTTLFAFLTENPSEAIILRIKEEGPRIGSGSLTFQQAFHKLQTTNPDLSWSFTQHIYTPKKLSALPTLGQLRGKILILQEFPAATDYGVRWRSTQVTLEDLWIIPSLAHLELKWTAIRDALVRSASVPADENESLYISHLSASVGVLPIEAAAGSRDGLFKGMNDRTGEWLGTQDIGRRGIVIMDFPGAPLVDAIIGQNRDLFV